MGKRKLALAIVAIVVALWFGRAYIFRTMAHYLIQVESPRQADLVIVLGGGSSGDRVMMGCRMVREGFAPRMWVSGVAGPYGHWESDQAVEFAAAKGCPLPAMKPLHNHVDSTVDEARIIGNAMKAAGYHTYIIVTSNYHTRRAKRLFQQNVPELEGVVIAAVEDGFDPDRWWYTRPGQKTFFNEWLKTVTSWAGL